MADFSSSGHQLTAEEIAAAGEVLFAEGIKDLTAIVQALTSIPADDAARDLGGYSDGFAANCLALMEPIEAATILNSSSLLPSKANSILAHQNLDPDKTQSILYNPNLSLSRLIEILTSPFEDINMSVNKQISSVSVYRKLTVEAGAEVRVQNQPGVVIAREIVCSGTLTKDVTGASGGSIGGGTGGGGLYVVCKTFNNSGTIRAAGQAGNPNTSSDPGGAAGQEGFYLLVDTDLPGKGGAGGDASSASSPGEGQRTGGGGGAGISYSGGNGGGSSSSNYTASDLAQVIRKATVDWYLVNVFSKTPTSVQSFPDIKGSGGGGGGDRAGGGGGGGGEIVILCESFTNSGTITAPGGDGAEDDPVISACTDCPSGGGGGGGGCIYVLYTGDATNNGTVSAPGGAGGAGFSDGASGATGVVGIYSVG